MRGNPKPKSGVKVVDYIYPAIFHHDDEDRPDSWSATFPDWQPHYSAVTGGDSLSEAMYMAADLLSGMILWAIKDGEELPKASALHELNVEATPNSFASLVSSKIARTKSVDFAIARVDCTMPDWLKYEAKEKGINFSKTLQDALLEKLEITIVDEEIIRGNK
jgi:predicted RNase H-like HicB family nuclease